jgi:branched-chain amino acid transport system substrate-binding protein
MRLRLLTAALGAAALACSAAANAANVKVGIILTYSGAEAANGQQLDRGIELFREMHPKVPGGHTIELLKRDDTGPNAAVAKRLAQELITRDKVDIIAGIVYSNNAFAIMELSEEAKFPVLIMNAGTASITQKSPYVARVSFTMWQSAYPMGKYAFEKMGIKTAAIAYANYAPGKDSTTAFSESFVAAGGKIVADVPFPFPNIPDFTPFLQRVKDAKPDALYVFVPAGKWATGVMKSYNELGMAASGIKLIGPGDITQDSELRNMGDVPIGVYTMHHYSNASERPESKAFVAAYKKKYGEDAVPDFLSVQGWDGMAALYHVVEKTNGKITGDSFLSAIKGWKYDSPRGPLMIDPETRDIVNNIYLRRVEKRGNSLANIELDTIPMVKDPFKALGKQ